MYQQITFFTALNKGGWLVWPQYTLAEKRRASVRVYPVRSVSLFWVASPCLHSFWSRFSNTSQRTQDCTSAERISVSISCMQSMPSSPPNYSASTSVSTIVGEQLGESLLVTKTNAATKWCGLQMLGGSCKNKHCYCLSNFDASPVTSKRCLSIWTLESKLD